MTKKNLFSLLSGLLMLIFLFGCQNAAQKNSLSPEDQAKYIQTGKRITSFSFKALSKEVIDAINAGGVQHAVDFCHLNANPLIDSLSKAYNAKIQRISDQPRNPQNQPDALDLAIIDAYKKQITAGQELQAHLENTGSEIIFYSPIIILNPLCLNCHGEPGSTAEQVNIDFIKTKYPEDKAVGYKLGDLRGVWKIVLSPES